MFNILFLQDSAIFVVFREFIDTWDHAQLSATSACIAHHTRPLFCATLHINRQTNPKLLNILSIRHVRALELYNIGKNQQKMIQQVLQYISKMMGANLSTITIKGENTFLYFLTFTSTLLANNIRSLTLNCMLGHFDHKSWLALQNLQYIKFPYFLGSRDLQLVCYNCPNIHNINMQHIQTRLTTVSIDAVSKLNFLHTINLTGSICANNILLQSLVNMQYLHSIYISNCKNISGACLTDLALRSPCLRYIDAHNTFHNKEYALGITTGHVYCIAAACPRLQYLNIQGFCREPLAQYAFCTFQDLRCIFIYT